MDLWCRPAGPGDIATVCDLLREGRSTLADQRGGSLWLARQAIPEPLESTIGVHLTDARSLVLVAGIDDCPLGVLVAIHDEEEQGRIATIAEVFVVPDARGVGLGEAMMDATSAWAAANGCEGIDGYALPGDRHTKNFFETFGLVARGIVVHRRLT